MNKVIINDKELEIGEEYILYARTDYSYIIGRLEKRYTLDEIKIYSKDITIVMQDTEENGSTIRIKNPKLTNNSIICKEYIFARKDYRRVLVNINKCIENEGQLICKECGAELFDFHDKDCSEKFSL